MRRQLIKVVISDLLLGLGFIFIISPAILYWFIHGNYERYIWILNGPYPFSHFGGGPFQLFTSVGLFIFGIGVIAISMIFKEKKLKKATIKGEGMMKNEKFIKKWEKQRELGKDKYLHINRIKNISVYLITCIILMLIHGSLDMLITFLIIFAGVLYGNIFTLPINWNNNEERYNDLKKNMK